ncbi:serine hydrolase domain-containing protein [Paenibacillus albidus]|uniref:serine hydrolase domain-containing protein n=1 Tax=Paenibacillus albidus TaxID=2041023 RepID=UPI001BEBC1C4|nr:serine hydrolase domain-containing protein [Paenibacillus albidus]
MRKSKRINRKIDMALVTLVLFAALFSSTTAGAASSFDGTGVDQYMKKAMERLRIPGAALGIIKGNRIIYLQGYGISGPEQKPVTPQTPFILGSTSKSITALAVMQLVEEGKVDLEAPVQRYLPWFRLADKQASAKITVRDLLHQTSGISEYEGRATMASDNLPLEAHLQSMKDVPLAQPVGSGYQYSNLNYDILGGIVQAVSQQPYGDYIKDHIFTPLDMLHSTAYAEEARKYGLAAGYQPIFGKMTSTPQMDHTASVPDGNLISSAEDLSNYLIAQMNGGQIENRAVLSEAGIEQMHKPASLIQEGEYYGMGWIISSENVWHNGTTENSSSYLLMDREYGIVLLFNSVDFLAGYDGIPLAIQQLLHGQEISVDKLPDYWQTHLLINGVLMLFIIIYLWSLRGLMKWRNTKLLTKKKQALRGGILILINILLPSAVLIFVPRLLLPWPVALLFLPGIAHFVLIFCLLLLAAGMVKAVRMGRDMAEMPKSLNH